MSQNYLQFCERAHLDPGSLESVTRFTDQVAPADEAQTLIGSGEGHPSPTPLPMCGFTWTDDVIAAVGHRYDPSHVCKFTVHGEHWQHQCGQCDTVHSPGPPSPDRLAALEDLHARAEVLAATSRAESRRIVDGLGVLLDHPTEEVALSPTVEATVTRDPASEAIATATRRMVHRIGHTIAGTAEQAWRCELPDLEIRIATRLEDAGLAPSAVRRITDVVVHDVRAAAVLASAAIAANTTQITTADVARNLLPRINKVMKETDHG